MKQLRTLAAVVLLLGASFGQNKTRDQNTLTFTVTGVTQIMLDNIGTQYNQWELVPTGTPATMTVTIAGCIRGGTCSATLATSSGTSAQILNTTGVYDYYNVTASWTGGTRVTVTVNRTATIALNGVGSALVTSVTGTANQITSTGGNTPVVALDPAITLPGTINKYTLTAPATGATLAISDNKSISFTNSIVFSGTDSTTMTFPATTATIARTDAAQTFTGLQTFNGGAKALTFATNTNCSNSGGTCSAAPTGAVTIAAAATTVTVATTVIGANSTILLTEDSSMGTRLSVTCNTTLGRTYAVTARTNATSFVITASAAPATNPACLSYSVIN